MTTSPSRRATVRLITFCALFSALFAVFFVRFEYGRESFRRSENSLCRVGVDLLSEGTAALLEGGDTTGAVALLDAALGILPLDSATTDSLARLIAAARLSPDNDDVIAYATALSAKLRLVSDLLTSPPTGLRDTTAILAQLDIELPLPDTVERDLSDGGGFALLDGRDEVSEGYARDIAEAVIGVKVGLRVTVVDGSPEVYSFAVSNAFADVTKRGGLLLHYSMRHTPKAAKVTLDEALEVMDDFVFAQRYGAIKLCDTYEVGGIIWAEYTVTGDDSGGIIKAGVASDTGRVCYFDASDYLRWAG